MAATRFLHQCRSSQRERCFFPSVFILEALFVQSKDGSSTLDGFYLSAGIAKASTAHDRYCHTNGARATLYIYFALSLAQMHSQYSRTSPEKWDATIFSSRVTSTWEISFLLLGSYAKYSACKIIYFSRRILLAYFHTFKITICNHRNLSAAIARSEYIKRGTNWYL